VIFSSIGSRRFFSGFVYFPNDETARKFRVNQLAKEKCCVTQCPKCLIVVDWSTETAKPVKSYFELSPEGSFLKEG
jgi:hypothetical protein